MVEYKRKVVELADPIIHQWEFNLRPIYRWIRQGGYRRGLDRDGFALWGRFVSKQKLEKDRLSHVETTIERATRKQREKRKTYPIRPQPERKPTSIVVQLRETWEQRGQTPARWATANLARIWKPTRNGEPGQRESQSDIVGQRSNGGGAVHTGIPTCHATRLRGSNPNL